MFPLQTPQSSHHIQIATVSQQVASQQQELPTTNGNGNNNGSSSTTTTTTTAAAAAQNQISQMSAEHQSQIPTAIIQEHHHHQQQKQQQHDQHIAAVTTTTTTTTIPTTANATNNVQQTTPQSNAATLIITTATATNSSSTPLNPHAQVRTRKETLEAKRERKAAKTLAIITGAFVVCWLPFFLVALLMPLCESCYINDKLASFFLWLGYFNSTLNPVIYTIFSPEFRQAFKRILFGTHRGGYYRGGKL